MDRLLSPRYPHRAGINLQGTLVDVSISSSNIASQGPASGKPPVAASKSTFGYSALLWSVELLLKVSRNAEARQLLTWITAQRQADRRLLSLVSRAWKGTESDKRITDLRLAHLNNLIELPLRKRNYPRLLYLAARYEVIGKNMPVTVGDLLARQLVSDAGRVRLRDASAAALKKMPNSTFLLYLNAVTTAKAGDPASASAMLSDKLRALSAQPTRSAAESKAVKRQFDTLSGTWRVVDLIAREEMLWLDNERGSSYATLALEDSFAREGTDNQSASLNFKEPLLQARDEERYLNSCLADFNASPALVVKLKTIKEMLRHATRRQLSYHHAYGVAHRCYDEVQEGIDRVLASAEADYPEDKHRKLAIQTLNLALELCIKLRRAPETEKLKTKLLEIVRWQSFEPFRWQALPTLVSENLDVWKPVTLKLRREIKGLPSSEGELKAFLRWAMLCREFEDAEKVFRKLKPALQGSPAALYFVNILQRQSRFTDALHLIKRVHAYMLAKPSSLTPFNHWNLVRRYGELDFLRKTSNFYLKEKQPRNPVGVMLLAARNIDQLRKYPLVVLMMLKRRGWAVIPLVEGLLPRELTGNPRIDVLHGCITLENSFRPEAEWQLPALEGFKAEPQKGILRWGNIDLSHSMMEDARIGRRAFNIDLTCPSLSTYLDGLCLWTQRYAKAAAYARAHFSTMGLRCGFMTLFNSRLPESLFRSYCDEFGDPDTFFCLHTANGYENYFKNFQTSISTRCVIRNVTKHRHVRASSMPIPEFFESYYQLHKKNIADVLTRIEAVASIRRTTAGQSNPDPAVEACEKRIMEWRAKGGKVVCLLGRVVCDSAVPFDGGPAHKDLSDWLNHSIEAVRDTDTLLLIKPHPHELNESIGTYLNEYFVDLIKVDIPDNVIILGHRWFDIQSLKRFVDLGLLYNGTAAVEMALLEIPTVLCGHFGPIDYPLGHLVPTGRRQYENMLRFKSRAKAAPDMRARAAIWLHYMSMSGFILDYRYHARPMTNKVVYPPYWIDEDMQSYVKHGDAQASILAKRAIGILDEPRI
ncbi:hypothetical protein [Kumtagia ephedrae]|uniref:hypothetical protein n=1 Tax=Kumtagia ephedrae TaxID=2116701 RepID=UPI00105717CE|nr:hypothetical protein [Mesorhizobium ephedrae]